MLDGQLVRAVDHLLALRSPAFMSASYKNRSHQGQLPDLRVQRLYIERCLRRRRLRPAEDTRRTLQLLALPLRDLVGMHIKLLRQLQKRLFTLQRRQSHLRLECSYMGPSGTPAHSFSA